MQPAILILNCGSSSIKFSLFEVQKNIQPSLVMRGQIAGIGAQTRFVSHDAQGITIVDQALSAVSGPVDHATALKHLLSWVASASVEHSVVAAGHRVVHGADRWCDPVLVDDAVLSSLDELVPLAPLHQPHNLAAIKALQEQHPKMPQVACFDTAFHQTQSAQIRAYALPRRLSALGLKRYGFHGLSYESIAHQLPDHLGDSAHDRVIVAHLGNGASLCAMHKLKSVATTMGFTALDGLMMGTRCGSIDPGVLLYLMTEEHFTPAQLASMLYHDCGLLGVSEISHDMRILLASNDARATEAIDLYVHRIVREVGSLSAALEGVDALVFTAGVGENAATIRAAVCSQLKWLGVQLDPTANVTHRTRISREDAKVSVWVIATNEERVIAQHTARALRPTGLI